MDKPELKLWHWYAGQDGGLCLLLGQHEDTSTLFVWIPPSTISTADAGSLIGPVAGPGEPPPAPKDREGAERMARDWWSAGDEITIPKLLRRCDRLERERDEWKRLADSRLNDIARLTIRRHYRQQLKR